MDESATHDTYVDMIEHVPQPDEIISVPSIFHTDYSIYSLYTTFPPERN